MSFVTKNNIEKVISTLQEAIVKCDVCAENAKTPVILNCGHIFCEVCLKKYSETYISKEFCPKCGSFQKFRFHFYPLQNMTALSDLINCIQKQSGFDDKNANLKRISDKNNHAMSVLLKNVDPSIKEVSIRQGNSSTSNSVCSQNPVATLSHSEELIKDRFLITNIIKNINLKYEPLVAQQCRTAILSVLDKSIYGDLSNSAITPNDGADVSKRTVTDVALPDRQIQCPHCQHKFNLQTENTLPEILDKMTFDCKIKDSSESYDGNDSEPETVVMPVEKILRKNQSKITNEKDEDNGCSTEGAQKILSCRVSDRENIEILLESDHLCDIDVSDDDVEIIKDKCDNSDIEIMEEIVNLEITINKKDAKYESSELNKIEIKKDEFEDVEIVKEIQNVFIEENLESGICNAENHVNKNSVQEKHSAEIDPNFESAITSRKRCRTSLEKRFEQCESLDCKKIKLNSSLETNRNEVKEDFNLSSNHKKSVESSENLDVTVIDTSDDELFSTCDTVEKTQLENSISRIQGTPNNDRTIEAICNLRSLLPTDEEYCESSDNNPDFLNKILTAPPGFQDYVTENNLTDNPAVSCPSDFQYSSIGELNIDLVEINSSNESFDRAIANENNLTSFDDSLASIVLSSQDDPKYPVPNTTIVYPEKESPCKRNNSLILKESDPCPVMSDACSNPHQKSNSYNFFKKCPSNSNGFKDECDSSFIFTDSLDSQNALLMAKNAAGNLNSERIQPSRNVERTIYVACSSLDEDEMRKVAEFCTVFKLNYNPIDKSDITHLIMAVDDLNKIIGATVKYFYAISGGRWILNMNWVYDSLDQGQLVNEEYYEVLDDFGSPGPKTARLNYRERPIFLNVCFCFLNLVNELTPTDIQVYEATTSGLVKDVLRGYNATVFAYGATGAGKTHTMVGDTREPGIMVRALNDLFKAVAESGHSENFAVTMSCSEIYNEQIRDLLNPSSGYLELREDSKGKNIQVAGLTEISTNSTDQVMQLLQKANRARTVEPTAVNKTSSRSHALVSVTVKQSIPANFQDSSSQFVNSIRQGRLFMIDLAGSERANKTKNRGKRLQEGAHINRSLLALGNCINALSGGAKYVNYRDSKLTRLLKDALSGNCKTVMVANISPAAVHKEETRNTLIYADRANRISTKAGSNVLDVNYHVTQYQTVISELRNEISRLKTKMQEERPRSGHAEKLTATQKNNEVKNLREQIVMTFKEQMRLRRKLMEIDSQLLGLSMDAERQHMIISNWESRNNKLYKNTRNQNSRAHTQQSLRRRQTASSNASEPEYTSDGEVEGELAVQQAWAELADIEKDQERWHDERIKTEQELELCRQHGVSLEDELPSRISTDDERELLALLCRVHELEADKMALQSERIARMHELRRRDTALLRLERQRQLSDAIITRQRQLMEEGRMNLPPDLQELYQMYQQEIHAATYADHNLFFLNSPDKLPSIGRGLYTSDSLFSRRRSPDSEGTAPSSADSDYAMSPLPPLNEVVTQSSAVEDRLMGHLVPPPSRSRVKFPPISTASSLPSKLPKSVTTQGTHIKRSSSDLNITTLDNTS